MDDLISRQSAIEALNKEIIRRRLLDDVNEMLDEFDTEDILKKLPSAQPERKKGTWINDDGLYRCSSCNMLWAHWWASAMPPERLYKEMKYCPRCGAEMREEKTDAEIC